MDREQILAVLYDLAMVIGGEIRLRPLLARTLQRLLFHTSFPCGMVFLGEVPAGPPGDRAQTRAARLELSIGDFELARLNGTALQVPAALVQGGAELAEDPQLLDRLPCRPGRYRVFLRLPVGDCGVIVLMSPCLPEAPDVPLTRVFQPVLSNLAKSILLCQANEAYTRGIEADVRQLAAIVECSDDAIVGKTLDGTIVSWNRGAEAVYGYRADEVKGRPISILVPPGAPDDVEQILARVKRGEHVEHYETLRQRKDGRVLCVSLTISPVKDPAGRLVGASVITRDITERKQAEEALRRASVYNRSLIEASLDPLVTIGPDGKITDVNVATEAVTGCSRIELIGTDFSDYFTDPGRARAGYQQVFREGTARDYELEIRHRDGHVTAVLYNASLYRDEAGAAAGVFAAARDVTERKRAENERRSNLEKLRKVMEDTVQAIAAILEMRDPYTAGHQRRVAQLAAAISAELGLPPQTVEGVHFGGLIHDIGKIYVPAEFLSRPGRLLELEFALIKTHPQVGYDLVKDIEFPWPVASMIHQHHEHVDGSGYPRGLKGDEIAFEARIVTVADVVEAMASHRPYRPARGVEQALEEVRQNRGVLYDATVVDACVRLFRDCAFQFQ